MMIFFGLLRLSAQIEEAVYMQTPEKKGCPKCGHKRIIAYFNAKGSAIICRRCGYHEGAIDDKTSRQIKKSVDLDDVEDVEQMTMF